MFILSTGEPKFMSSSRTNDNDFNILLSEYTRLINSNKSFKESIQLIPVLIRHGAFTPSRLEGWPFPLILSELDTNPTYRIEFIKSFNDLIYLQDYSCNSFTLNEKKGVAILLAAKDSFNGIIEHLKPSLFNNCRILLAALEYSVVPLEFCFELAVPCVQAEYLVPKLKSKYPLLVEFLVNPNISKAKEAFLRLREVLDDLEAGIILRIAARVLDSKDIYNEIVVLMWESKNEELALVVLDALSESPDLKGFCEEYLNDLKDKNKL